MVISYLKILFIIIHTIICSILAMLFSIIDRSFILYYKLSKIWSKGILLISGIRLSITGLENFDHRKIYVFVSNHSSQYDIPSLQYSIPVPISIVFKKELSRIPLFGWQLKMGPYIMIDRDNVENALKSIEEAKKRMAEKRLSPLVFAEGTRSKTGEVQPFKRGAFYLASRVGFPIVPVSVSGASKILPKGKFRIKRGTIYVHFDSPVSTENISTRRDELDLMEKVRNRIIENMEKV